MSGRDRGRRGHRGGDGRGGRGSGRDQPSASSGGGRGRGRGGGGGRGLLSSQFPSSSAPAPVVTSLINEMEQKLTLQTPSPAEPRSPLQQQVAPVGQLSVQQSSSQFPSSSAPAPVVTSLRDEMEQKITVQSPAELRSPLQQQVATVGQPSIQQVPVQRAPSSSKAVTAPKRPGYGTIGRRCVVKANHFLVEIAERDLHQYDVSITPDVTSKKVCRNIISLLVKSHQQSALGNRKLAYDGRKNAYTAGPLPFSSKDFVVTLIDEDGRRSERQFKVSIKFAAKADLHNLQQFLLGRQLDSRQETIQALDVVLRVKPSENCEVVGRSFFSPSLGDIKELSGGVEFWRGFYQSLRPTQMGLSLNVDMSGSGFYEPTPVSDFIFKNLGIRDPTKFLSNQDFIKVQKALKGVRVELNHLGYTKRCKISGLSTKPTSQLVFNDETGTEVSVVQYFRRKYNIALRYANLPAILVGRDSKQAYLPVEICKIVEGQRYSRKLNERQVTELLRATCQRPKEREEAIRKMVGYNNYNRDDLVNKEFGMHVRSELTSVDARVLPPPRLQYHETGRESLVDPQVGQWNMINKKMVDAGKVNYWTCVSFSRSLPDPSKFCWALIDMCTDKGMVFRENPLIPIRSAHPGQVEKTLRDIYSESRRKGSDLQLLIIVLPDVSGSYGKIKRVCETELGIVSQCCQPRQASQCKKQYLENVALKINVKVGGRNTFLELAIQKRIPFLTDRPTIVFGADVTHPPPGEDSSASIAAVVASMDWPEVTKYRGLVSAQGHRDEIIQDLYTENPHGGIIRELLIAFRRATGLKPHRIIFYRDGVSEGQFSQVLLHEVDAIRKACNSLEEHYQPPVTFVVVQKRHHTRLFPVNHGDRNSTDRSGNILPGTVVDTKICHPTEFDFYLNSHAGIQGTSRPTHYHVLYDENGFNADALQTLTNNLCYTYARCTRSVSIVPPAYYAHLAAFRARHYAEDAEDEKSDSGSSTGATATRERNIKIRQLPRVKDNVKEVMFYC